MMNMRRFLILIALLLSFMVIPVINAQESSAEPVVQVALFYSPTCTHCHTIINEYLPPVIEKYGETLEIFYINVQEQSGAYIFYDACNALGVPQTDCGGVPAMVIGQAYLVGSAEIPARMESLVTAGLASGGINLSHLPYFWQAYEAQNRVTISTTQPGVVEWQQRFATDPFGNSIAVIVLIALVVTLLAVIRDSLMMQNRRARMWWQQRAALIVLGGGGIGGVLMMLSLTLTGDLFALLYAAVVVVLFMAILMQLSRSSDEAMRFTLIPAAAFAGLMVAVYLSYIEVGQQPAVCGVVGDCNTVQTSPYAAILGVPIGVIGVIGYVMMLLAWALSTWQTGKLALRSQVGTARTERIWRRLLNLPHVP